MKSLLYYLVLFPCFWGLHSQVGYTDVQFQPGKLGMRISTNGQDIVVEAKDGMQAHRLGVEVGMRVVAVNDIEMSGDALAESISTLSKGEKPYTLRFAVKTEEDDEPLENIADLFAGEDTLVVQDTSASPPVRIVKCCCLPGKEKCKVADVPQQNTLWGTAQKLMGSDPSGCLSLVGPGWHSYHKYAKSCLVSAQDAETLFTTALRRQKGTCQSPVSAPELQIEIEKIENIGSSPYRFGDESLCRNRQILPYVKISFGGVSAKTRSVVATADGLAKIYEPLSIPMPEALVSNIDEEPLEIEVYDARGDSVCALQGMLGGDSLHSTSKVFLKREPVPLRVSLWRSNQEQGTLHINYKLDLEATQCKR